MLKVMDHKSESTKISTRYETKKPDGSSKTVSVREVENGFIIDVECYYPGTGEGENRTDSKWENKQYISKVNPFGITETTQNLQEILKMVM